MLQFNIEKINYKRGEKNTIGFFFISIIFRLQEFGDQVNV